MRTLGEVKRRAFPLMILGMMLVPALAAASPSVSNVDTTNTQNDHSDDWWESTTMDSDGDYIHDAIWIAAQNNHYEYLDENNKISVIVDFDHTPTSADQSMLEKNLGFETQFRYWLIDSVAGKIDLDRIPDLVDLPGVVFLELDASLGINIVEFVTKHCFYLFWHDT